MPRKRRAGTMEDSNPRKRTQLARKTRATGEATASVAQPSSVAAADTVELIESTPQVNSGSEHQAALVLLHKDFESLRSTLTCKICEKLCYEPYVLSCGHTYCYRCVSTWFTSNRKMTCPNCRVNITQLPSPAYAIKEMVAVFTSRVELLPEGETVEEHETWKKEEADFLQAERDNHDPVHGGLFQGRFNREEEMLRPTFDEADGVPRCPYCLWELEDDMCGQCGLHFDEDGEETGSFDSFYDGMDAVDNEFDPEDSFDEGDMPPNGDPAGSRDVPSERHRLHAQFDGPRGSALPVYLNDLARSGPGRVMLQRSQLPDPSRRPDWNRYRHVGATNRPLHRPVSRGTASAIRHALGSTAAHNPGHEVGYEDYEDEDFDEEYDEDADDAGSLDDFVVNDSGAIEISSDDGGNEIADVVAPGRGGFRTTTTTASQGVRLGRDRHNRRRIVIDDDDEDDDDGEDDSVVAAHQQHSAITIPSDDATNTDTAASDDSSSADTTTDEDSSGSDSDSDEASSRDDDSSVEDDDSELAELAAPRRSSLANLRAGFFGGRRALPTWRGRAPVQSRG